MMNKWILTGWLVAPLAVVSGLWAAVDRDAARKSRDAHYLARSTGAGSAVMADTARAGTVAKAGAAAGGAAANTEPKMVRPESLEQGFVIVVKDKAGLANKESPIHMASSHNGWDPGDKKNKLESRSDLRWQIVLEKPKIDAPIAFKFTRGNWDTCEASAKLEDIDNRGLPLIDASKLQPGEKPIIELEVQAWVDQRPSAALRPDLNPYYRIEGKPYIKRLQVAGGGVAAVRDVLVCLPPGYDDAANASKTYPVLYMQDGQNLFTEMPGTQGSWKADETLIKLVGEGAVEPFIIVGIPHLGKARAAEYLPVPMAGALEGVKPNGDGYADFVVGEVMPRVERAFRVRTGAASTAIGGASLGAVAALNTACRYPSVFGKVLLESMPLIDSASGIMKHFEAQKTFPGIIYFAIGGQELGADPKSAEKNKAYVASADAFRAMASARAAQVEGGNVQVIVENAGTHDEKTWARRFVGAARSLFVKPAGGAQ